MTALWIAYVVLAVLLWFPVAVYMLHKTEQAWPNSRLDTGDYFLSLLSGAAIALFWPVLIPGGALIWGLIKLFKMTDNRYRSFLDAQSKKGSY
jgi:hypothetical protein